MTPPPSAEPMHCDHERVCWFAHGGMRPGGVFEHPCRIPCKHDTRTRGPVAQQAPATEITINAMEELLRSAKKWNREGIAVQSIVVVEEIERIKKLMVCIQKEHDAALIAQEREKLEREKEQQELQPSFDDIDELNRKVEFYQKRLDMLQCWQSSMRDPERKIVCDILANGFTLTTKEEINNAATQAREDVLKEAISVLESELDIRDRNWKGMKKSRSLLESLRSEVGK